MFIYLLSTRRIKMGVVNAEIEVSGSFYLNPGVPLYLSNKERCDKHIVPRLQLDPSVGNL